MQEILPGMYEIPNETVGDFRQLSLILYSVEFLYLKRLCFSVVLLNYDVSIFSTSVVCYYVIVIRTRAHVHVKQMNARVEAELSRPFKWILSKWIHPPCRLLLDRNSVVSLLARVLTRLYSSYSFVTILLVGIFFANLCSGRLRMIAVIRPNTKSANNALLARSCHAQL